MSYKLTISVTQEILDSPHTCKRSIYNCAIARAVKDIFPDATMAGDYWRPFGGVFAPAKTTPEILHFVLAFDRGEKMQPASFELEIPDWVIEKIDIEELKPLLVNHPTLELIEI